MPNQELSEVARHSGHLAVPLIFGMVEKAKEKMNEMTGTRWFDQIVGAGVSAILIVLIGYMMGIPKLQSEVSNIGVQVQEVRVEFKEVKKALTDDKLDGRQLDANLDARLRVMEAEYQHILATVEKRKGAP